VISYRLPLSFVLAVSLAIAACGGEGLTLPPEGAAAHVEITAGDEQQGRVQDTLDTPLAVLVTDSRNRPVAGAIVVFTFTDGADGGEAIPPSVTTGSDGQASTTVKLGSRSGVVAGIAEVAVGEGVTPVRASFTLTSLPADAAGIRLLSGNDQSATVNSTLPLPLVVEVTDASGNPIANVPIQWTVQGGGSVSEASNVTDANGRASVTRTLGGTAGTQTTLASAEQLAGSPVTFTHTATAGGAASVVKFSGDNQSAQAGTPLANPLVVQVLDAQGNPIPNRAVTWVVAEGAVSPETSTTDAEGKASTSWTVGSTPGAKTANAVVSGVGTATFNAIATAGAVSGATSDVSADPTTINVGGASTITVLVRDGSNNPVAGAAVSVAASGSGNTITPATASSDANGVARFTFSSTVAEAKTITATAGGVTIADQAAIAVQKAASSTRITRDEPDRSTAGETVKVEYSVTAAGGTPTGTVTITVSGGNETCSASVAAGQCDIVLTETGNPRVLTATYSGDDRFNASTDNENHRVDPAPVANNPPTAAFTPPSCTVGQPCQFTDQSSDGDGSIASRSWTFQDGAPPASNDQNPMVTFASEGSKTVTLTVTDNDGAQNSVTHSVTVSPNQPPTAAFAPQPCGADRSCGFLNLSTDPEDVLPGTFTWTFGDPASGAANTSSERHPTHIFSAPGTYDVTLEVRDSGGLTDTETQQIIVP